VHLSITQIGAELQAKVPSPFAGVLPDALGSVIWQLQQADDSTGTLPLADL
jgi:hypothetical protein